MGHPIFLVHILIIGGFIFLGILLSQGKCSFLIAGYNLISKKKKESYNEGALCRFMGKIMYGVAFSLLILLISTILQSALLHAVALCLLLGSLTFAVIYANTGDRFKK